MIEESCYFIDIDNYKFIDKNTDKCIDNIIDRFSYFKHGSIKDIKYFSNIFVNNFIKKIKKQGELHDFFKRATFLKEYIVLMSPGYRNTKAAINLLLDFSIPKINTFLYYYKLTPIIQVYLPRLADKNKNYASLNIIERKNTSVKTDHILMGKNFYDMADKKINVIYIDDISVTGLSSQRTLSHAMANGANSSAAFYMLFVDKKLALKNPSIEAEINKKQVSCLLDKSAEIIFNQRGYIPILRSIDILLKSTNKDSLLNFLEKVNINNIYKSYISYINNTIGQDDDYTDSLEKVRTFLNLHLKKSYL
jgi:hypothetical protein